MGDCSGYFRVADFLEFVFFKSRNGLTTDDDTRGFGRSVVGFFVERAGDFAIGAMRDPDAIEGVFRIFSEIWPR